MLLTLDEDETLLLDTLDTLLLELTLDDETDELELTEDELTLELLLTDEELTDELLDTLELLTLDDDWLLLDTSD